MKMTENADVATPEAALSEIRKEALRGISGGQPGLPCPLSSSYKVLYGRRKRIPNFEKSLLFAVINTAQRPGENVCFHIP